MAIPRKMAAKIKNLIKFVFILNLSWSCLDSIYKPIDKIVEHTYNPIIALIWSIEKPVICAVNGVAAGAGANIALACDITIASEKAKFIQSFTNIGLVPDSGGTFFLPRLIGHQRASYLIFSGEKISA